MALACENGNRECDGCGRCFEANPYRIIALCAVCDEPVLGCEDRYEFPSGEIVHDDCVMDYIRENYFRRGD